MSNKLNALNAGQVLGRSEMKKIMAGSGDCELYKCCNSAGVCTQCVYAPGGVGTCGHNDTKEYCCWPGS
jgi:hypothetical protein